jgi:sulfate transport system permease protein
MTLLASPARWRRPSVIPGFGPALGFTLFYLTLIVLIPLAALALRPWEHGVAGVWDTVSEPRVLAALKLSFGAALIASAVNSVMGVVVAWVLVRYQFPGRGLVDAAVDLPFALPTAVAGIALATVYGPHGWIGAPLAALGIKVVYTPVGVLIALIAVGLPFVVRTVQPILAEAEAELEDAASTLGATPWQWFSRVLLPALTPAVITGFSLAFARAVGEYGSVIFIAGNMPMRSEIAPLVIVTKLEQFDYAGAAAVGLAMLVLSFAALLIINGVQLLLSRRGAAL